jgi:hypothetical protein
MEDGIGMKQKSKVHKPIVGFSDRRTVKVDLDNVYIVKAKFLAFLAYEHFNLKGFLILRSSNPRNYQVVFDRPVSWNKNVAIVAWIALKSKYRNLTKWLLLQLIREYSTLRISNKGHKKAPRIVYRFGCEDHQIKTYLETRKELESPG